MSDALRVEQRGDIRWLLLNRPAQRNALNGELVDALDLQVDDIAADEGTSVVVIAGEGPGFSAGGDFRHFLALYAEDGVVDFLTRLSDVVTRIERSPKTWVAALHGHAIAGGLEIALACDIVLAEEGTLIGDGHVNNRLLPGAGSSVRLERSVGRGLARWMHLSGSSVTAEELFRVGWLREVAPRGSLRERAQHLAEQLAERDSATRQSMKALLSSVAELDEASALQDELSAFGVNWKQNAVAEALTEFLAARRGPTHRKDVS